MASDKAQRKRFLMKKERLTAVSLYAGVEQVCKWHFMYVVLSFRFTGLLG